MLKIISPIFALMDDFPVFLGLVCAETKEGVKTPADSWDESCLCFIDYVLLTRSVNPL